MTHNRAVPRLGVLLVTISLFLPYITFFIFELSGIRMIETFVQLLSSDFLTSEGTGELVDVDPSDMPVSDVGISWSDVALTITSLMLYFSPIFFLFCATLSALMLMVNKSTRIIGIVHLGYTSFFLILAMLSTSFYGIDIFRFLGIGFYIGAFSSICFFVYNPPSRGNYRSRIPSHVSHDFEEGHEEEEEFPIWLIFIIPLSIITLIALFLTVRFLIFIFVLSLFVSVALILRISSSKGENDSSKEDSEYEQMDNQHSETFTGEILQVGGNDNYVKNWEDLPQGEWLETDTDGTHWYQAHDGVIWYSTELGYTVWEES